MKKSHVIIVGAGPAGTTCAFELAKAGHEVIIFDHKAPWDKPCGGMLGPDTFDEFEILKNYTGKAMQYEKIKLCSFKEKMFEISFSKPIYIISRFEFNKRLLEKSIEAGACHIKERVVSISKTGTEWVVSTGKGMYRADIIIGADGVNGITRRSLAGKFKDSQLAITCGYKISGTDAEECFMKFYDYLGYCWYFKNSEHASVGTGCMVNVMTVKELYCKLDEFLNRYYPDAKVEEKWSAFVPVIKSPEFYNEPFSGDSWMLTGDAAGHVLSPNAEGIFFSMKSGLFAAHAVIDGDINKYKSSWNNSYGEQLKKTAEFHSGIIGLAADFGPEIYGASIYKFLSKV